jgi:hypothetical protein
MTRRPRDEWKRLTGKALRLLRTERRWTQAEVCAASGTSITGLSTYENGTAEPRLSKLLEILAAMDATLVDFQAAVERVEQGEPGPWCTPSHTPAPPAAQPGAEGSAGWRVVQQGFLVFKLTQEVTTGNGPVAAPPLSQAVDDLQAAVEGELARRARRRGPGP